MNTLSNGAIAVGSEGSWMRFHAAYEHELEQAYERGIVRLRLNETIAQRTETMMLGIIAKTATAGESMKSAAKACGIKENEKAIRDYLVQARRGMIAA
jgi:hypothetical protein